MPLSTLFQEMIVEPLKEGWQPTGSRVGNAWAANGIVLSGALSAARPEIQELFGQGQADQIFTLSVPERRYKGAKVNDRMTDEEDRHFFIRGMDDMSSNDRWCLYFLGLKPGNG